MKLSVERGATMDLRNLEELKREVESLQEQKALLHKSTKEAEKNIAGRNNKIKRNEREMVAMVQSMMAESQMADIRDRELTKDAINKMTHAQRETNKQIIKLNDYLSDTTALKTLWDEKRRFLEETYSEEENTLRSEIRALKDQRQKLSNEKSELEKKVGAIRFKEQLKAKGFLFFGSAGIIGLGCLLGGSVGTFFRWLFVNVILKIPG